MVSSPTWSDFAIRFHPHCRRDWFHHQDRELGPSRSLSPVETLEGKVSFSLVPGCCGQYLRQPIHSSGLDRRGDCSAAGCSPGSTLPETRDHGECSDGEY